MNNGKYHTEEFKLKQAAKNDRIFGPILEHTKICECCGEEFVWEGRRKTKAYEQARFCSRSCANNRSEWWKENATHYRTICFHHHEKKCLVCGFNKIVAAHHVDGNKENNVPENLVPLCSNHHEMIHHPKWHDEVQQEVDRYLENYLGAVAQ